MTYAMQNFWKVEMHRRVAKQVKLLPLEIQSTLRILVRDLKENGPRPLGRWKHDGKLRACHGDKRHCHLSAGRPTYVCCWEVINKSLRILEVYYVGTHEKAPY